MKSMKFSLSGFAGRLMMAGFSVVVLSAAANANNVRATLEGSLLVIKGDSLSNQITINQNAAGDIVVSGQAGTLINQRASVRFPRVQLNALEINMYGGNDVVNLRNLRVGNDVFVNLGAGADRIASLAAAPIVVGANMTVEGGEGNDVVRLEGTAIGGDLSIEGGTGVLNAAMTNLMVYNTLTVIGDDANDIVNLTGTVAGGNVSIETKKGADRVTVSDLTAFLLAINTDEGVDVVTLDGITVDEDLGVFTGTGNDTVLMLDLIVNKNLTVSVDAGDDRVSGADVAVAFDAVFEGGIGTDTFEDYGITGGEKKDVKEFEVFLP